MFCGSAISLSLLSALSFTKAYHTRHHHFTLTFFVMLVSHPHPINGYLANKETCIKRDGRTIGCNACDVQFQYFQTVADLIWFEMYSDFWNGLNLSVNTIINLHVGVDVISRSHLQRKSIRKRLLYFRIIVFLWLKITFSHSLSKSRFYEVDIQCKSTFIQAISFQDINEIHELVALFNSIRNTITSNNYL